jgi:hypothetical protein
VTYVVRLNGAVLGTDHGAPGDSSSQVVAELFAQYVSMLSYRGQLVTVHDGHADSESAVVAVYRDGFRIGPASRSGG